MQDPSNAGPGIGAFLAFFFLAVALWLLMRNMNARMRRMAYRERDRVAASEAARALERAEQDAPPERAGADAPRGSAAGDLPPPTAPERIAEGSDPRADPQES